jgi:hypothetical protein
MEATDSVTSIPCTVFWLQRNMLIVVLVVVAAAVKCRVLSIIHVQIMWFADYPCTVISC